MNKLGVYKITNTKTNRWYIGSSVNILKRWKSHKAELKRNKHNNHKLQVDWNNEGAEVFIFEILQECKSIEEMVALEQSIIDIHFGKPYFYNLTPKVDWKENGWFHGEETKNKIGLSKIGKKRGKAFSEQQSRIRTGVQIKGGWHHTKKSKRLIGDRLAANWASLTEEQRQAKHKQTGKALKNNEGIKAANRKRSKLTYEDAQTIRAEVNAGIGQRELARRYDVRPGLIFRIVHGQAFVNP